MKDSIWLPIEYRSFHDVPRLLRLEYDRHVYFLDSPFSDRADEYADAYTVYKLDASAAVSDGDWQEYLTSTTKVGEVKVNQVTFDETRRKFVLSSFLSKVRSAQ